MGNRGPNKSTYKAALKKGAQLVIRGDRAYLHPSMAAVDFKAALKLADNMKLVSVGVDSGEEFYDWVPE